MDPYSKEDEDVFCFVRDPYAFYMGTLVRTSPGPAGRALQRCFSDEEAEGLERLGSVLKSPQPVTRQDLNPGL